MNPRFYSAQDGHNVLLIAPQDVTGGKTSPAVALKLYSHISIFLALGVSAAAPTNILVKACTDAAGDNATPVSFHLFACETSNSDVLGPLVQVPATGYAPSANDEIFYVLEIDAAHLPQGYPYLQLQIVNGANSVIACAHAVLSGSRYAGDQSPTVLA